MSQQKSTDTKSYKNKRILDNILWLIENYLPQKEKKSSHLQLSLDRFKPLTFYKIKKFASGRSKSFSGNLSNSTVSFTIGNWALTYLNFLKRIKLLK